MSLLKAPNSDVWYEDRYECKVQAKPVVFPGQQHEEQQCTILNMSITEHRDPNMVSATSCNERFAFACFFSRGSVSDGINVFAIRLITVHYLCHFFLSYFIKKKSKSLDTHGVPMALDVIVNEENNKVCRFCDDGVTKLTPTQNDYIPG
jgi:hypothetical protein